MFYELNKLFSRFGYASANTNAAAQNAATTHLQNQNYNVCVRRAKGYCYICWADWYTSPSVGSFGLSVSPTATAAKGSTGTRCSLDYITVRWYQSYLNMFSTISYRFLKEIRLLLPLLPMLQLQLTDFVEEFWDLLMMLQLLPLFVVST